MGASSPKNDKIILSWRDIFYTTVIVRFHSLAQDIYFHFHFSSSLRSFGTLKCKLTWRLINTFF